MTKVILLARDRGEVLVDDDDFDWLSRFKWHAYLCNGKMYAKSWVTPRPEPVSIAMHAMILPWADEVDHGNGNGLDNQRHNLREATRRQQMQNRAKSAGCSSQFKGVSWDKRDGVWQAYIGTAGKDRESLGRYGDEVSAAKAYDAAAKEKFGPFARLNFP